VVLQIKSVVGFCIGLLHVFTKLFFFLNIECLFSSLQLCKGRFVLLKVLLNKFMAIQKDMS
jgi:hypothetical protein